MTKNETVQLTIREFAEQILSMPNIVFAFVNGEPGTDDTDMPYGITILRIFETWSAVIDQWGLDGGKPYMFDLPDFVEHDLFESKPQSEECIQQMINGLNRYCWLHALNPVTWHVDDTRARITVTYKQLR